MQDYYKRPARKRSTFSRIFLEVSLTMIFVFIMTYSPGKNNSSSPDLLEISSQESKTGQGQDLKHANIQVTSNGFIFNGKALNREDVARFLEGEGKDLPLLRIEPDQTMHENLRWLLNTAGNSHEIELALKP